MGTSVHEGSSFLDILPMRLVRCGQRNPLNARGAVVPTAIRIECQHGIDHVQDRALCNVCQHEPIPVPDLPSARELGISSSHRRSIMREGNFRVFRRLTHDVATDPHSSPNSVDRFHARAVDYLTSRAAGESRASIIARLYPR